VARLFITPREIDFISDLTKEITKDVIGQKIYYYKIREDLTEVHEVYEEAMEKIFDPPIEIEALVEWQPEELATNRFGSEEISTISIYLHARDLLDKDILIEEGDYFSYGTLFFEMTSIIGDKTMFGQVEHITGFKVTGKQAREGQVNLRPLGPLSESVDEPDALQQEFVQQRGREENKLGKTGDVRELQKNKKLEPSLSVSEIKKDGINSSFYGDN
jgi:hypothetical protein